MASTPAIELAPGVFRIPTAGKNLINSFALVQDDGSVTLVDTGLKRAPARIVAGLAAIGKHPRDVTRIVLTHVHPDHAGGAAEMSRQTGAPVLVHGDDHGWARTGRIGGANDRSTLLGRLFARTGDARIEAFEPGPALSDGEVLPVSGGLRVVHTPGPLPRPRLAAGRADRHADHRRRAVQLPVDAPGEDLAGLPVLGLRDDQAHGAPARRAGVRRRGVHPRTRDHRPGPRDGARDPGRSLGRPSATAISRSRYSAAPRLGLGDLVERVDVQAGHQRVRAGPAPGRSARGTARR